MTASISRSETLRLGYPRQFADDEKWRIFRTGFNGKGVITEVAIEKVPSLSVSSLRRSCRRPVRKCHYFERKALLPNGKPSSHSRPSKSILGRSWLSGGCASGAGREWFPLESGDP